MTGGRKYAFSWGLLGDIGAGRPNLGPNAPLQIYRLMQFCFRDVLERRFGTEAADQVFFDAGFLAGTQFYRNVIGQAADLAEFVRKVQGALQDLRIGVLRIEKAEPATGSYVLTVAEDLDCSGLPESGDEVCVYDEGFIAALFQAFTGREHRVKEVDCWCSGDRTCRFTVNAVASGPAGAE